MTEFTENPQVSDAEALSQVISRRGVLRRAAVLGLSVPAVAGLLAACGSDDSDDEPESGSGTEPTPADLATEAGDAGGEPTEAADATAEDPEDEGSSEEPSGEERELIYAYASDVDTLDPQMTTNTTTHNVTYQMFETLIKLDREGGFEGVLAESWEFVDELTWDFTIRQNVTWHNGDPFTAHDVEFSFARYNDPELNAPGSSSLALLDTVEATDDFTVRIVTTQPNAAMLSNAYGLRVVPRAHVEKVGADEFASNPIGTGPFKFVERTQGVEVVMEAYEDHWRGKPAISRLVFRPIPEASTRIAALQNNEVNWIAAVSVDRVAGLEEDDNLVIASRGGQGIYGGLDTLDTEPLKDVRVRHAINHAVNVKSIVEDLLVGLAVRLPSVLFVASPGFDENMEPYAYDPDRARQLLEEAGYPDGFDLELSIIRGYQAAQKLPEIGEAIAADLREVGINCTMQELDPAAGSDLYEQGEYQFYLYAWGSAHESGRHILTLLHSEVRGYYYQNEEADALIEKYMAALDDAERKVVGKELNEFFYEEAPWLFLYQEPDIYGYRSDVKWEPNPYDNYFHAYEVE